VDQSQATYGIVLNPLPGALDVGVSVDSLGGATLNGSPAETANTVHGQGEVFDDLLIHARANADVSVAGGGQSSTTCRLAPTVPPPCPCSPT